MKLLEYSGLPSMVWPYVQVLRSRQPMLAPAELAITPLRFVSHQVRINTSHLRRYRAVCGITDSGAVPPAYLHVLAMPLHMRLFVHPLFPVKVLGLVHLRNVIRQLDIVDASVPMTLSLDFNSLRDTDSGQEYDLITRAHQRDRLVWEEVATMLARRHKPGARPNIERAKRDAERVLREQTIVAPANTGRRYAFVSGDFNPIHLFDRTAQAFQFKQCVAHGMWSLARCLAAAQLPAAGFALEAEFKLPIYLPGEFIFRQQAQPDGSDLTLTTPKGDRLHLIVKQQQLASQ